MTKESITEFLGLIFGGNTPTQKLAPTTKPGNPFPDKKAIACNYREAVSACKAGALAYVTFTNPGGGSDRIKILARSRSGRWIETYEPIWRLENFRLKTVPRQSRFYTRGLFWIEEEMDCDGKSWVKSLNDYADVEYMNRREKLRKKGD